MNKDLEYAYSEVSGRFADESVLQITAGTRAIGQKIAFQGDREAIMFESGSPWVTNMPGFTEGLRMTGVMRKGRLLRRFLDCSPEEIELGDRVIFEYEERKKHRTFWSEKVTHVEYPMSS
jgi:hypothetical protein